MNQRLNGDCAQNADFMAEEHDRAVMSMGIGITMFIVVLLLAPILTVTIKRMTMEIQIYATEALERQKVSAPQRISHAPGILSPQVIVG